MPKRKTKANATDALLQDLEGRIKASVRRDEKLARRQALLKLYGEQRARAFNADVRVSMTIVWFDRPEWADEFAATVRALGYRRNGGYADGALLGRAAEFDYFDVACAVQLYAVTT